MIPIGLFRSPMNEAGLLNEYSIEKSHIHFSILFPRVFS